MDPALKIPAWPAIKACNLSKMFTILQISGEKKGDWKVKHYGRQQESIMRKGKTNQWRICPNQRPPVVSPSHANWLRCLNLAPQRDGAVIIWSFSERCEAAIIWQNMLLVGLVVVGGAEGGSWSRWLLPAHPNPLNLWQYLWQYFKQQYRCRYMWHDISGNMQFWTFWTSHLRYRTFKMCFARE